MDDTESRATPKPVGPYSVTEQPDAIDSDAPGQKQPGKLHLAAKSLVKETKLVAKAGRREAKETALGAGHELRLVPGEMWRWGVRHEKGVAATALGVAAVIGLGAAGVIPVHDMLHSIKGAKQSVMHGITKRGYVGVAGGVGAENIGLPLPGETILVTVAGLAAKLHNLSLPLIIGSAAGGGFVFGSGGWLLGRCAGGWLTRNVLKSEKAQEHLKVLNYMFKKYGGKVVFMGRWMFGIREIAAIGAGMGGMSYKKFALYNAAGAVVWAGMYGSAGYYGEKFMESTAGKVVVPAIAFSMAAGGFGVVRHWLKKTKLEMQAEELGNVPPAPKASGSQAPEKALAA